MRIMKNTKTKKTSNVITLKEFDINFSNDEKNQIAQEAEYLKVLIGLKNTRKLLGLTQQELAQKSHIPRATVAKIENGHRNTTIKTMLSLADAMGKKIQISWV